MIVMNLLKLVYKVLDQYCFIPFILERPDFEGGLILRRGCTAEHVVNFVCLFFFFIELMPTSQVNII